MSEPDYARLLDPGMRDFLAAADRFYPPEAVHFTVAEQRAFYDRFCAHFRKSRPRNLMVRDEQIGGVACRTYRPAVLHSDAVLLYLHGGGFMLGGLESHDDICAELADQAGLMVVAADYRLVPEHVFPAALEDCWAVLCRLHLSHPRLLVAGDSAGGNIAAALCLKSRDEDGPAISGQILIYPGLGGDKGRGSYVCHAKAPGFSTEDALYYDRLYGGSGNPYACPLLAAHYHGLPAAFVVTSANDPVADDGAEWVKRLKAAGVKARLRNEPALAHAFLRARHHSAAAAASFKAIVEALRSLAKQGD